MFALFTQLLPWNGEGRDVSSFEAMYIVPHPKEAVKLVEKVHKQPVEGVSSFDKNVYVFGWYINGSGESSHTIVLLCTACIQARINIYWL